MWGWVDASGWAICGVFSGVDISRCEDSVALFQKFVNSSEDLVGFRVSAPARPPSLNDTVVVSKDFDARKCAVLDNRSDK